MRLQAAIWASVKIANAISNGDIRKGKKKNKSENIFDAAGAKNPSSCRDKTNMFLQAIFAILIAAFFAFDAL